jgi:Rps23 Pro-64 3,4-dihydroxylase Tpa1-like proline 4-hydroxylase
MNFLEAKIFLKENGYCSFNLKDYNQDYFDFVKNNFNCNEENNLQKYFTGIRAAYKTKDTFGSIEESLFERYSSFEEANQKKLEILNESEFINQLWLYSEDDLVGFDRTNKLRQIGIEFVKDLYDIDSDAILNHNQQYSYYNEGCRLPNHSDGTDMGRICACLIYFNENYEEKNGGNLILNNEYKVIPEMGNVAIIDLQKFEVPHEVTKVDGGIGRFAFISFVSYQKLFN